MIMYCVCNKFVARNPKMGHQFLVPGTNSLLVIAIRMEPDNIFHTISITFFYILRK